MSTKNYVYVFIGLLCVILLTQPLCVQASSTVYDEIEQSIPCENINTIDKPIENKSEEQTLSPENTNSVDDSKTQVNPLPEGETETQISSDENITEDNAIQEDISEQPKIPIEKQYTTDSDKNIKTEEQPKRHCLLPKFLNKFISNNKISDKLGSIFNSIIQNSTMRFIRAKLSGLCNKENKEQIISTIDFAPYYFLTPPFLGHYLETFVFQDKITNIAELLPYSLKIQNPDVKIEAPKNVVTPQGVTDLLVLMNAPSPQIEVKGKSFYAKLVIDIRNNTLYKYDKNGFPLKAYLVATGARGTRTNAGLRIVTYKERFPYSGAPNSKRGQDPYSYGPYIIFLNKVDPKTGRQCCVEQLLHGNGNEYSIGKKVSHGCVRTNNNVMRKELSKEVVRGDYILLINPDVN